MHASLIAGLIALASTLPLQAATQVVLVGAQGQLIYEPQVLTIAVGDRVRFTNVGGFHNVVANDGSFRCANGCDGQGGSGAVSSALWTATVQFNEPGTIGYYCAAHGTPGSGMTGTIIVQSTPVSLQSFRVD
ncbi:MAG: plastocyanin/azurin family copper-binding protein [Tahibacter sp.]